MPNSKRGCNNIKIKGKLCILCQKLIQNILIILESLSSSIKIKGYNKQEKYLRKVLKILDILVTIRTISLLLLSLRLGIRKSIGRDKYSSLDCRIFLEIKVINYMNYMLILKNKMVLLLILMILFSKKEEFIIRKFWLITNIITMFGLILLIWSNRPMIMKEYYKLLKLQLSKCL